MYRVHVASRAQREHRRLRGPDRGRVDDALHALTSDPRPRGAVKLQGPLYRLRVGSYRIIYAVSDGERLVVALKIARREKDTYEHLDDLL